MFQNRFDTVAAPCSCSTINVEKLKNMVLKRFIVFRNLKGPKLNQFLVANVKPSLQCGESSRRILETSLNKCLASPIDGHSSI